VTPVPRARRGGSCDWDDLESSSLGQPPNLKASSPRLPLTKLLA
jgi:hypothetical protein